MNVFHVCIEKVGRLSRFEVEWRVRRKTSLYVNVYSVLFVCLFRCFSFACKCLAQIANWRSLIHSHKPHSNTHTKQRTHKEYTFIRRNTGAHSINYAKQKNNDISLNTPSSAIQLEFSNKTNLFACAHSHNTQVRWQPKSCISNILWIHFIFALFFLFWSLCLVLFTFLRFVLFSFLLLTSENAYIIAKGQDTYV